MVAIKVQRDTIFKLGDLVSHLQNLQKLGKLANPADQLQDPLIV